MGWKISPATKKTFELCHGYGIKDHESEEDLSEDGKRKEHNVIGFFELFRFATLKEWIAFIIGVICCGFTGIGIPISNVIYGEFTTLLIDRTRDGKDGPSTQTWFLAWFGGGKILVEPTPEQQHDALIEDSLAFLYGSLAAGLLLLIFGIIGIDLLNYAALQQISRIRHLLLQSMMRQDMAWYDTKTDVNFASKISEDLEKMKEGMGEKVGVFLYLVVTFVFSVLIGFYYGWKLTLVVLSSAPFIILSTAIVAKVQSSLSVRELKAYGCAGTVAEEVLASIRTVAAFGGESIETKRYEDELKPAQNVGTKKGLYSGLGAGIMWFISYISYAIAFYYGINLIVDDWPREDKEYTPAVLIIVFFGVLAGAQNLGLTAPHIEAFSNARAAAHGVFAVIDRVSLIDSLSTEGEKLEKPDGDIVFENIHFHYPSRTDMPILRGLNLTVKPGETVALVGSSGSGKSTCIQLIQRLYDPVGGRVTIGGQDIKKLNITSLRDSIGVVGQEPVLFATTIRENIRYGRPNCTDEEIEIAAKDANCHHFIRKLPEGYNTMVGERGAQLSGGQKQRIAIARALVRRPTILLLDEATSALDTKSQSKVQRALDKACEGRTTIIVSHRISTIVNADKIVVLDEGKVVEMGKHQELLDRRGPYYQLVSTAEPTLPKQVKTHRYSSLTVYERPLSYVSETSISRNSSLSLTMNSEENILDEKNKSKKPSFTRILKLNYTEWPFIVGGCIAAFLNGATLPIFAIVFGQFYGILSLDDRDEVLSETKVYCMYFVLIGIVTGLCTFTQMFLFSLSGARLTSRLRSYAFSSMIAQDMSWYDDERNSVGALCSRLAGDCSAVQGATGSRIGSMLQAFTTIVLGFLVSLFYSWKLTLVSATVLPLVLIAVFLEARFAGGIGLVEKESIETASKIATEAITNIRTVASLCQEQAFIDHYVTAMAKVTQFAQKKVRLRGFIFSLGQTAPFVGYAVSLCYGGIMVANKELKYEDTIIISEALIYGSWMLGQALAYAPNVNTAIASAKNLFALFDRVPLVKSSPDCKQMKDWQADGDIEYSNVYFNYPNRPDSTVLKGLELDIKRGATIALVGPSGCGKSTCIQLLLRFYDPRQGDVELDGSSITEEIPLDVLRSQMGLVGQEPVLFDRTIAANIQYGDNSRVVPLNEVMEAAKNANIHQFITALPMGYETRLGPKGAQLSGGQKQRIAIARALVRHPRVLLLDEATSALDVQSEKAVQDALDKAKEGRTCIVIAHRLSTVRNADVICVLDNGQVGEKGTHEELMAADGLYKKLYLAEQPI